MNITLPEANVIFILQFPTVSSVNMAVMSTSEMGSPMLLRIT
jgi:hypothetical protein